jgi:Protein of unknown function (DUF1569)
VHPQLEQALAAVERATAHLDAAQIARPVPGKWSVADILDHLRKAFTLNAAALDKAVETGRVKIRTPTVTQWMARTTVLGLGYFPKARAPEATTPGSSVPPERLVGATREGIVAVDAALTRAADRFGEGTPILNHPYFAAMSSRQWRAFHWRHTIHHMKQVRDRRG